MGAKLLALFGTRVTIVYKNGAKVTMRYRQFDVSGTVGAGLDNVTWKTPRWQFFRKPLWLNVNEIYAVYQGKV